MSFVSRDDALVLGLLKDLSTDRSFSPDLKFTTKTVVDVEIGNARLAKAFRAYLEAIHQAPPVQADNHIHVGTTEKELRPQEIEDFRGFIACHLLCQRLQEIHRATGTDLDFHPHYLVTDEKAVEGFYVCDIKDNKRASHILKVLATMLGNGVQTGGMQCLGEGKYGIASTYIPESDCTMLRLSESVLTRLNHMSDHEFSAAFQQAEEAVAANLQRTR